MVERAQETQLKSITMPPYRAAFFLCGNNWYKKAPRRCGGFGRPSLFVRCGHDAVDACAASFRRSQFHAQVACVAINRVCHVNDSSAAGPFSPDTLGSGMDCYRFGRVWLYRLSVSYESGFVVSAVFSPFLRHVLSCSFGNFDFQS